MLQKPFDFNIHLPCRLTNEVDSNIANDLEMDLESLNSCFESYLPTFRESFYAANFMIFSLSACFENGFAEFVKMVKKEFPHSYFTLLLDFRDERAYELLYLKNLGFDGIKFHSYIQKIEQKDYAICIELAKRAQELGLFICIDTSYGSTKMYEYDNLRLAANILDFVKEAPLILLHSGGLRVMEAMLLADMCPNVYLDTSLSLLYYDGAPLWDGFGYVYKKLANRVLYGSDFPFFGMYETMKAHEVFFAKYGFGADEIDGILRTNALGLRG